MTRTILRESTERQGLYVSHQWVIRRIARNLQFGRPSFRMFRVRDLLADAETDVSDDLAAEALFQFSQDVDLGDLV